MQAYVNRMSRWRLETRKPVILPRILLRLHAAVLPLLLFVVVATGADVRPLSGVPTASIEAAVEASARQVRVGNLPRTITATANLDVDDDTDLRVASTAPVGLIPARCLAIVSTIAPDHAEPPTHRPCAAPPTGPPHA
jgi:hypothetical protein